MGSNSKTTDLDVAIIGGGIAGLTLALGLQARNVNYKIYERASSLKEIGAGVGFSPNAEWAMQALNEDIHTAFKKVANPNGEDYFQWVDGYATGELIYKLFVGEGKFQGCRRSDFVDELVKLIPPENVVFGKEADKILDGEDGRPNVVFKDGESVAADMG
jgi:salicylate hydroxylase